MDYEKAYKDLIKRIKDALSDQEVSDADFGVVIGQIAPELAQSEDERIRRGLISHLKELREWKVGTMSPIKVKEHYDAWIAYLEKQKDEAQRQFTLGMQAGREEVMYEMEKEPHYSPLCNTIKDKIREYIANHFIADRVVKTDIKSIVKAMEEGIRLGKEEQKPTEWREEDKTMLERCISKMANIIHVPGKHGLTNMSFEKYTDEKLAAWLKSLPERFKLQPKQEWSEEEERHLYNAIEAVKYVYDVSEGTNGFKCVEFLKSFHPQPHWKPSEEQMEALRKAFIGYTSRDLSITLKSLYEQLKQL